MQIDIDPNEAAFIADRAQHVADVCRLLDRRRTALKMVPLYGAHIVMLEALQAKMKAARTSPPTVPPPNFATADRTTTLSQEPDWRSDNEV